MVFSLIRFASGRSIIIIGLIADPSFTYADQTDADFTSRSFGSEQLVHIIFFLHLAPEPMNLDLRQVGMRQHVMKANDSARPDQGAVIAKVCFYPLVGVIEERSPAAQ